MLIDRHGPRNRSITWDVAIIVSCSMQMTMALLLLLGVYKRSRPFLLPWLVVQLVLVLLCMAAIFIELHVIQLVYIGITLPLWYFKGHQPFNAYINPEGKEIRVSYVADSNGFRVLSNALPEGPAPLNVALPAPVQDTPEVAAAKAAHLAAVASVKAGVLPASPVNTLSAPLPVEDTPEVKQAKGEFFAAFNAASIAAAAAPEK